MSSFKSSELGDWSSFVQFAYFFAAYLGVYKFRDMLIDVCPMIQRANQFVNLQLALFCLHICTVFLPCSTYLPGSYRVNIVFS